MYLIMLSLYVNKKTICFRKIRVFNETLQHLATYDESCGKTRSCRVYSALRRIGGGSQQARSKLNNLAKLRLEFAKTNGPLNNILDEFGNIAETTQQRCKVRLGTIQNFLYVMYTMPTINSTTTWQHVFIHVFYFLEQKKKETTKTRTERGFRLFFFANHPPSICLFPFDIVSHFGTVWLLVLHIEQL